MAAQDSTSGTSVPTGTPVAAPAASSAVAAEAKSTPSDDSQHNATERNNGDWRKPGRNGHKGHGQNVNKGGKGREKVPWNNREVDGRPRKRPRFERDDRRAATGDSEARASSNMRIPFSAEEIAAEERRPKRKVAVMIGYAGTGYRGMQINHDEKTIEGDLFAAFVAAGAIAKANADDPKKSSLVRCARTDKGVHAAGNVISLKLIIEDADVVDRINAHLPPQIRVWGIQRTVNSFSCYQACDSRWYEYLLPSYALLPPHPESFLGREMAASARKADEAAGLADGAEGGAVAEMRRRLDDVRDFWADVERDVIAPLLASLDPEVRQLVVPLMHSTDEFRQVGHRGLDDLEKAATEAKAAPEAAPEAAGDAAITPTKAAVEQALRDIKTAYVTAKRRYRATPVRIERLQEALSQYEGTHNFHNYTVQKSYKDASAQRHIKSFVVNPQPIQIRDTEWLSLKVHGQSFMMHQIRKMVAMAVMVTRCGTPPAPAMALSYGQRRISIPRAPGFGLLLERPVFDSYNARAEGTHGKMPIDFGMYEAAIQAFKDREIYSRMWDVEEEQNVFHAFFHQLDEYRTSYYLWAVPGGFDAAFERFGHGPAAELAPLPGDLEEDNGDGKNRDEGKS